MDQDQAILDSLIDQIFQERAYELDFNLLHGSHVLKVPEGTSITSFIEWAGHLPEIEQPSLLGLPASAATVIATNDGMSSR